MKLEGIRNVLFITLSNIGDVILTLPILTSLKENFPLAEIDILVGPRPKDIFTKDPRLKRIFVYDKHSTLKDKIRLMIDLRSRKYDLAVDMRTSLIPFLIGSRHRRKLLLQRKKDVRHKKLEHLEKLKDLGIHYEDRINIYIDPQDRQRIDLLLKEKGVEKQDILIGINPSGRSILKKWRIDGFVEVIKSLLQNEHCRVVLIGDETQMALSKEIVDRVGHKNLIDLTGKTNLGELCALIERLKLLLTCDSAALHIASDLGIKVVALFGPTDYRQYGPTGKDDIVIKKDLACSPCKKAECNFKHECMENISASEVLEAIKRLLRRPPVANSSQ